MESLLHKMKGDSRASERMSFSQKPSKELRDDLNSQKQAEARIMTPLIETNSALSLETKKQRSQELRDDLDEAQAKVAPTSTHLHQSNPDPPSQMDYQLPTTSSSLQEEKNKHRAQVSPADDEAKGSGLFVSNNWLEHSSRGAIYYFDENNGVIVPVNLEDLPLKDIAVGILVELDDDEHVNEDSLSTAHFHFPGQTSNRSVYCSTTGE